MANLEFSHQWTISSTGYGKFIRAGLAQEMAFAIETSSGCTASVQIVSRWGSSAGPDHVYSTQQTTVSDAITSRLVGPLGDYVSLRVKDKTAGGTTNVVTGYVKGLSA